MDSELIKLVNKLQDTFSNLGGELDMPQLVVVGSQSAGKSSVLETIVGRDFLPRGQGIVTRRPLILQLIHTAAPDPSTSSQPLSTEWGQFMHTDKRFTDFNEIRKEIEQETFRVAGQNKGISKLPISLRIYSSNVLDLTLVDLPGLTKIPVGDQPSDIERQIRSLVLDYISKPNSVILAVSAANVDLANSDSLKLARSVDPQGRRTIGVLTKLDIMDAGTNALDILTGRIYPLKLGFIGVVNRSQADINAEKSLGDSLESETEFFKTSPVYRHIAHKNGTKHLAKTLNSVLLNHIRDKLPDMKARLNTLIGQAQQELNSFGDSAIYGDKNQQGALVLRLMTQFARDFVSSIEGTKVDISTKELSGGARIYYIFNDVFGNALAAIDCTKNLDNQDIRTAIRNSTGPRPSLFIPETAFDLLVKPQIKVLEGPSLRCVEMVYEELVKICHNCTSNELQRFPALHARLIDVVSDLLRERLGPTSEYAQSLIEIQAAYINTQHPAFVSMYGVVSQSASKPSQPSRPASSQEVRSKSPSNQDDLSGDESAIPSINGPQHRDGRSVSASLHERSRTSTSTTPATTGTGTKLSKHHSQHSQQRQQQSHVSRARPSHRSPSPPSSGRETFLHYFFGQNGTESSVISASAAVERSQIVGSSQGVVPVGREVSSETETSIPSGLMSGKRSLGGSNAVYDMKSLGRHIEAVGSDSPDMSPRDEMETNLIRSLIASYFSIVRQSIQDLIPKAIMHFLVNHTAQQVQNRLVAALYKPEFFSELLNEDESLVAERTRIKALLDAYKEAFKTLSDVSIKPI